MDTDGIDPDFIENETPKDGEFSVTGLDRTTAPIHGAPVPQSHAGSLATPNLGSHVMDNTEASAVEDVSGDPD